MFNKNFKIFVGLILLTLTSNVDAQSTKFSIKEAISFALENNIDIKNAKLDENIALQNIRETRGIGLPQLSGTVELLDNLSLPTFIVPNFVDPTAEPSAVQFGQKYNATASLNVNQLIFSGSYIVALQASQVYAELSKKSTSRTIQDIGYQVKKAYYTAQVNQVQLELLNSNIERLENLYKEVKILYETGFAENLEVKRLEVNLNNVKTQLKNTQQLVELSYQILKFQMNFPLDKEIELTDKLEAKDLKLISSKESNPENRPEYQILNTQVKLNQLDLKRYKSEFLPSLGAFGSFQQQAFRDEFNFFDSEQDWYEVAIIGARLTVPIFNGLQTNAQIQKAKINVLKTQNTLEQVKNSIALETQSAVVNYNNAVNNLNTQKLNVELATSVLDEVTQKYKAGVGSNLEILDAENTLKEAETNYSISLLQVYLALADYEKSIGLNISE
jgi:outer membrane protein TolC